MNEAIEAKERNEKLVLNLKSQAALNDQQTQGLKQKVANLEKQMQISKDKNDEILIALERELQKKEQMLDQVRKQGVHKEGKQNMAMENIEREKEVLQAVLAQEK